MSASRARKKYERLLRQLAGLRKKASLARDVMISFNRVHVEDVLARKWTAAEKRAFLMRKPLSYRKRIADLKRTAAGRAALKAYEKFWELPYPPQLQVRKLKNGAGRKEGLWITTGLGRSPVVLLAKKRGGKIRKLYGNRKLALDPVSRRLVILNPKSKGPIGENLKFVGYAPETHYVPTRKMELAGTFKKGKYWVHEHNDDGGEWPEVYKDSSGNFIYGNGTYKVDRWLRR